LAWFTSTRDLDWNCQYCIMRIALAILSGCFLFSVDGSTLRQKRDDCQNVNVNFDQCTDRAYQRYKEAFQGGDDGRPDWMARKSCNYYTEAVEECSDSLLGECYDEDTVIDMKDKQLKNVMFAMEQSIEEWDSQKCPAFKAHIDRVKGKENVETDDEDVDKVVEAIEEQIDNGDGEEDAVDSDNDVDNDGINNEEDNDDDNDGLTDDVDTDDDNDGILDEEDSDDDNDGTPDDEESAGTEVVNDEVKSEDTADIEGDGEGNGDDDSNDGNVDGDSNEGNGDEGSNDGSGDDDSNDGNGDSNDGSGDSNDGSGDSNDSSGDSNDGSGDSNDGSGDVDSNEGNNIENDNDNNNDDSNSATKSVASFWVMLVFGYKILN